MSTPTENQSKSNPDATAPDQLAEQLGQDQAGGTAPQASNPATFPEAGGSVLIMAINSVATGETREVLKLIADSDRPGFQTMDGEVFYLDEQGEAWRFPTEAETAPYRCPTLVTFDGETSPCGTLLGRVRADCVLCKGARCYVHCGSIDHFPGKLISRGGTDFHEWRTKEIAARFFMAQLYRRRGDQLTIVETVGGVPGETHPELFRRFEAVMAARISMDSQLVLR